jgi:pyruvate dehydrogenase E1 component alpha subunit
MAYRFQGHSLADAQAYREQTEVQEWEARDPIASFLKLAIGEGLISEEDVRRIDAEIDATVEESVTFANESPEPTIEALYENVYDS